MRAGFPISPMTSISLQTALSEVERLPQYVQDELARDLMEHIERVRILRDEMEQAARSLDGDTGRAVDIDDIIERARH